MAKLFFNQKLFHFFCQVPSFEKNVYYMGCRKTKTGLDHPWPAFTALDHPWPALTTLDRPWTPLKILTTAPIFLTTSKNPWPPLFMDWRIPVFYTIIYDIVQHNVKSMYDVFYIQTSFYSEERYYNKIKYYVLFLQSFLYIIKRGFHLVTIMNITWNNFWTWFIISQCFHCKIRNHVIISRYFTMSPVDGNHA